MQGNGNRVWLGYATNSAGDIISSTLPLDTRWDVVPGTVKIQRGASNAYSWTHNTTVPVAIDDGAGNIVGQVPYTNVTGSINYATGAITINENADNPFTATVGCWVEFYERFPSNTPADDFDAAYQTTAISVNPLVLHRFDHSSFPNRNLVNHGQWCMLARQITFGGHATAKFLLKDPDFFTDRPVMSEIAIRCGYNQPAGPHQGARLGPLLIQRAPNKTSGSGYLFGPNQEFGTDWAISLLSGNQGVGSYRYEPAGIANGAIAYYTGNHNITRYYTPGINNTPPNLLADDWHKFRMITTFDADPGDLHIHLQVAIGHAEVDKAVPVYTTFADAWHQIANTTVINTLSAAMTSKLDQIGVYNQSPYAYPPTPGYQGFYVGGHSGPSGAQVYTHFDAFRCFRMP